MKKNYSISSFLTALVLFLLSSTNVNAQNYWTQQYNGLTDLYDITGIIGYGSNMILGGTPYYTPTATVSFTASSSVHKIYRFAKLNDIVFGVGDSAIFKSLDNGQTWTATNMSAPIYNISSDARLSVDGTTLYTWDPFNNNFGNDVLKSVDSGNTWVSTTIQKPDGYGFLVHNSVIYATSIASLQYSTNNGNTWLYVTTIGSTINEIIAVNNDIFAATNLGVFKSTDNGQHWIATIQQNALCLCLVGSSIVCGTQGQGIWESDMNGIYWISRSEDLPGVGVATGVYKPITALSYNDQYIMATALYDTTNPGPVNFHSLYTMPITALNTADVTAAITNIQVYPNPAKDEIFINTGQLPGKNVKITLFDMQGRVMQSKTYNTALISINPGNIPPGSYIVNINDGSSSVSKKIEIVR